MDAPDVTGVDDRKAYRDLALKLWLVAQRQLVATGDLREVFLDLLADDEGVDSAPVRARPGTRNVGGAQAKQARSD